MAARAVLLLIVIAALPTLAVLAVLATRTPPPTRVLPGPRLAIVRRNTTLWRWCGVLLGLALAACALLVDDPLGRGVMLAAPLLSLGILLGVIVGELRVSAPAEPTRQASVEVRRLRDYLPPALASSVGSAIIVLAAVLTLTTIMGSPDALGHSGRTLVRECSDTVVEASGPWPGVFYSAPLAVVVAGGLAAAVLALRRVVRRPRQGEDTAVDDSLRVQAAGAVTAATGVLVGIPLAGVSLVSAIALFGSSCPVWWSTAFGATLVALVPMSLALVTWCVVVLAAPARSSHRLPAR